MATPTKAPITCHILDTNQGQPARNVRVRLELTPSTPSFPPTTTTTTSTSTTTTTGSTTTGPEDSSGAGASTSNNDKHPTGLPVIFESSTDDDGRVKAWLPYSSPRSGGEVPVYTLEDVLGDIRGRSRWTLRFDTGGYFAAQARDTFFPEVTVVFEVAEGQHYHVPLLLAPFSYSTYRGS
ncbi:hypothetical protein VSDG_06971 [Cytospora chrysosperma]|uniref:hydroxyisourate hydrolase n=1 Tax=Cytospora chrysosperma TaxID=252740 RepID=A0A423VRK3_CYTCH|nr:hypothetical protein VSDG_06971 [Valsa sordida]